MRNVCTLAAVILSYYWGWQNAWDTRQGSGVGRLSLGLVPGVTGQDRPWAGDWTGSCGCTFAHGRKVLRPQIYASKISFLSLCCQKLSHPSTQVISTNTCLSCCLLCSGWLPHLHLMMKTLYFKLDHCLLLWRKSLSLKVPEISVLYAVAQVDRLLSRIIFF